MQLPQHFNTSVTTAWERAQQAPGELDEMEFLALMLLAVAAPMPGAIVELGGRQGKSTVGLATLAQLCDWEPIVSVDPRPESEGEALQGALRVAGVLDKVETHRDVLALAAAWSNRPIRLLVVDGDPAYASTLAGFRLFSPHLAPGALLAVGRTLEFVDGPIRVFVEEVLRSDRFGAAGFMGSLGWAHHLPGSPKQQRARAKLARRAGRLLPLVSPPEAEKALTGMRYSWARMRVPHKMPEPPQAWADGI